jgi:hypothetical protein|tara:strand:- start:26278 stop:26574 length:297 start_codon:yes stop_codon:yes gene_type:complete
MNFRKMGCTLAVCGAVGFMTPALAEEPLAEKIQLKDGSTLYLHPDGTGRMIDQHGKPMSMADGTKMETKDGRVIMMENKRVWVRYGPPGKGRVTQKID